MATAWTCQSSWIDGNLDVHSLHSRRSHLSLVEKDSTSSSWRTAPHFWACWRFSWVGYLSFHHDHRNTQSRPTDTWSPVQQKMIVMVRHLLGGRCPSWKMLQNWPFVVHCPQFHGYSIILGICFGDIESRDFAAHLYQFVSTFDVFNWTHLPLNLLGGLCSCPPPALQGNCWSLAA